MIRKGIKLTLEDEDLMKKIIEGTFDWSCMALPPELDIKERTVSKKLSILVHCGIQYLKQKYPNEGSKKEIEDNDPFSSLGGGK